MNIPNWVKVLLWIAVVLVVLVLLKINIQLGSNGFSITQGLVR